jgi:RNA polymerase sigma-70 factor, ECF subfamily
MNEQDRHSLFSELIARHQSELYAYIFAIARNLNDTDDLYQTVCLVLWRKFDSFRPGSSFFAWARQTAKLTVRKFMKRKQSRTYVSEDLIDVLADTAFDTECDGASLYIAALEHCRQKLAASDDELLELRYVEDLGSRQIAEQLGRPQQSVCQSLKRIRRWLLECVQAELARQERSCNEH